MYSNYPYQNVCLCSRCPNMYYCAYINRTARAATKTYNETCGSICPHKLANGGYCYKYCYLTRGHDGAHECPDGHTW